MDDFEVRLTTPSGAELPSVAHEGTRWYIAEQGDEVREETSLCPASCWLP